MKADKSISLLKLGGSLLTDKNQPYSLRKDILRSSVRQIIDADEKLILIHGGGSFGHPIAKTYRLTEGLNPGVPNQIQWPS